MTAVQDPPEVASVPAVGAAAPTSAAQRPVATPVATRSAGSEVLRWTTATLFGLTLWLLLFGVLFSGLEQQHKQEALYTRFRYELNQGIAPLGGVIPRGVPVAMINASRGGLHDLVVVEGSNSGNLRAGPGHYPGSPLPGQVGTSEILGRGTTFGAPFADLSSLHQGDTLTVTTDQGVFTYVVEDFRKPGQPQPPALTGTQSRITLTTAQGGSFGFGSHVAYLDALLKGAAVPTPPGASNPTRADVAFATDSGSLYPLVLWLQALVLGAIALVWARRRWGGMQTWIIGVPLVLAVLWGASNEVWGLLPNLL